MAGLDLKGLFEPQGFCDSKATPESFTSVSRANIFTFGQHWQPWGRSLWSCCADEKLKASCHGNTEHGTCCPLLALAGNGDPAMYKCLDQAVAPKSGAENLDEDHRCSASHTNPLRESAAV